MRALFCYSLIMLSESPDAYASWICLERIGQAQNGVSKINPKVAIV